MIDPVNSRETSGASVASSWRDVQRDDHRARRGEAGDEPVPNFASRAGDER